jgi:acetyl esterase/lipase
MTQPQGPHELQFVVKVPVCGTVTQHARYDVYRPDGADGPLPAVVFVPGPVPPQLPVRPRGWPVYQGYGQLVAGLGVIGIVVDQPFHTFARCPALAEDLATIIESVRALDEVDPDRIGVWAFSGGAMLVGRWLADSPEWLRCLSLTYPILGSLDPADSTMLADVVQPGRPLVLTRVGKELVERQATVDRFLAAAEANGTAVQVLEVLDGQHGFDALDHTEESRQAVIQAADLTVEYLLR